MSWNYRVMRTTDPDGTHDFAIHEVHYDEFDEVTGWTARDVGASGETFRELCGSMKRYNEAIFKPVIAIEPDGLYEIGPMGNSKPHRIWKAADGNQASTQSSGHNRGSEAK